MRAVFEVTGEHLDRLDPDGAVRLVRELVWSDATASGIAKNLINIPSAINDADGGIDGEVVGAPFESKCGIIKAGNTRYQIKSGKFSLSNVSNIEEILLKKNTELKPRIKSCLEKNGTLVIVLTGWDSPDRNDGYVESKFLDILGKVDQKYKNSRIEVWRQNTIIGFLQNFPSLELGILGIDNAPILTRDDWSKLDDMGPSLHLGNEHKKYIGDVREELRGEDRPVHIRVTGEPGIGKTRLVLESTGADDLAPVTVYVEDPTKLEDRNFLNRISRADCNPFMVLVVDECDSRRQANLWNRLKVKSPGIKLVTIFNEPDSFGGSTIYMNPPPLGDAQIGGILEKYGVREDQTPKWVEFCRPSPRAAHIIGQNLSENPDDIFKSPDTVPVWDRYVASRISLESDDFKNRKSILLWLSLFKKFGSEWARGNDVKTISKYVEKNHGIRPGEFNRIVGKLKEMKILQGNAPWYITPKMLHIKMWTEWWETVGSPDMLDLAELATGTGAGRAAQYTSLFERYCEMFEYAKESPCTGKAVKEYLRRGGPFEERDLLATEPGAELLTTFARVDPKSVLEFLKRFVGAKGKDELVKFKRGRRQAVLALETICKKSEHFADASELLLALGEAENESYSNNASGVFAGLFSPGLGRIEPSGLPLLGRLPVLGEALQSDSKERRLLAVKACAAALRTGGQSAAAAQYYDGIGDGFGQRQTPAGELAGYCGGILDILASLLETPDADQKQEVASVILGSARFVISVSGISEAVVRVLRDMHVRHGVDNELIIAKIIEILDFEGDRLPKGLAKKLNKLQDEVTGSDYHSLMRRYVGMAPEIDFARTGSPDSSRTAEIKDLAKRSLDAGLLGAELEWLPTDSAKNGSQFGYELGKADGGFVLLPAILDAQKSADGKASGFFLGGYFAALRERDLAEWESRLDLMSDDPALCKFVAEVTWRSGMTDRAGKRIISLIQRQPDLGYENLDCFRYGGSAGKLSEAVFLEWMEFLKNEGEHDSISLALSLFYDYFVRKVPKHLPGDLALCLLFHRGLAKKPRAARDAMLPYRWKEICLQLVKQYPDGGVAVGEKILKSFADGTLFDRYSSHVWDVLDEIARNEPAAAWKIASRGLEAPQYPRALITRWFRGVGRKAASEPAGEAMLDEMLRWAGEDPGRRAAHLAYLVPPNFELARRVLGEYGGVGGVAEALASNFDTEGWAGPASVHYEEKKEKFANLLDREKDLRVRDWLNYYVGVLDDRLNVAKAEERM